MAGVYHHAWFRHQYDGTRALRILRLVLYPYGSSLGPPLILHNCSDSRLRRVIVMASILLLLFCFCQILKHGQTPKRSAYVKLNVGCCVLSCTFSFLISDRKLVCWINDIGKPVLCQWCRPDYVTERSGSPGNSSVCQGFP